MFKVNPGGPAERAGLQGGDIIMEFNGHPIGEMKELPPLVSGTPPGTKVNLKVLRAGKQQRFTLMIASTHGRTSFLAEHRGSRATP